MDILTDSKQLERQIVTLIIDKKHNGGIGNDLFSCMILYKQSLANGVWSHGRGESACNFVWLLLNRRARQAMSNLAVMTDRIIRTEEKMVSSVTGISFGSNIGPGGQNLPGIMLVILVRPR